MPIYRFETSNAYTKINADGYDIDRNGTATFRTDGRIVAILREWQTIIEQDAIHVDDDADEDALVQPASGLPL